MIFRLATCGHWLQCSSSHIWMSHWRSCIICMLSVMQELVRRLCHMSVEEFDAELMKWTDDDYYSTHVHKIQLPFNQVHSLNTPTQTGLHPGVIASVENWNTHTTVLQPFYRDYLGEPVPEEGLYGAREDNRGRHTQHLAGCHSIQNNQWPTSIIPPIFMPDALPAATLPLAWDRHQICWLAYPVENWK